MRRSVLILTTMLLLAVVTSNCSFPKDENQLNAEILDSSFIFLPESLTKNTEDLSAIYAAMAKYYEGVEKARPDLLDNVFHAQWLMRDTDSPNREHLNVEDKPAFIKRVSNHGPYPGYAQYRSIVNVGRAYDNLAFVRVNKDPSRSATSFFLFKVDGEWKITDKVWLNPRDEHVQAPLQQSAFTEVRKLIENYYKGLARADDVLISRLLHNDWELKYMKNDGSLTIENKEAYVEGLKTKPAEEYIDHSQLLSIELYHDGLAIVRVDQPAASIISYLTVFKVNGVWLIVSERRSCNEPVN